jgi:hypothetical protein
VNAILEKRMHLSEDQSACDLDHSPYR